MDRVCRMIRGGLAAFAVLAVVNDASATAIASVNTNQFSLFPYDVSVGGRILRGPGSPVDDVIISIASQTISLTETEVGNATVNFIAPIVTVAESGTFFSARIGGTATASPDGYAFGAFTYAVTLAFTNLSGLDLDYVSIRTVFSAFNPGGSPIGARVDNSALEFARFSSSQSGPGIGDSHQCDTRVFNLGTTFPSTPPSVQCGVPVPDASEDDFAILDFDQNETVTKTFALSLILEASSVPEPSTLTLLCATLMGVVAFGAFRSPRGGMTCSKRHCRPDVSRITFLRLR